MSKGTIGGSPWQVVNTSVRTGFMSGGVLSLGNNGRFIIDDAAIDGGNSTIIRREVNEITFYEADNVALPGSFRIRQKGGAFGLVVGQDTNDVSYFQNRLGIGTTTPLSILDINGAQTVREIASASAPTPAAGKAFLYADDTSHTLKLSLNGAAYGDLATTSGVSTNYVAKAGDTMTGPLVNNSNSASTALAVTQSGAGAARHLWVARSA